MLSDLPEEERHAILRDSCDQIEEKSFTRKFLMEETNQKRAEFADVSMRKAELMQELKDTKDLFKAKLKPLEEREAAILGELKSGGEFVRKECYKFLDQEEGIAAWYDERGYMIDHRPLRPEEKQRSVFQALRKTGTDN